MKRLGKPVSLKIDEHIGKLFFGEKDDRKAALQELFDWMCSRPNLNSILLYHNRSPESLDGIYSQLVVFGAGQWVGGSFVAAAALAHPHTLRYLLRAADSPLPEGWSEGDRWMKLSFDLVEHFRTGRPVEEDSRN